MNEMLWSVKTLNLPVSITRQILLMLYTIFQGMAYEKNNFTL